MMPINQNNKKQEDPQIAAAIEKYKEQLQMSSAPSDKWIEAAAKLMGKYHFKADELGLFTTDQLENILNAYENGDFTQEQIESIMDVNLNATQMSIILMGYAQGATVEQMEPYFTNSGIPYLKMNYMVSALVQHGVDMMKYIDYDPHQIYEIFAGIVQGLDYTRYDDKSYPAEVMGIIRHALAIEDVETICEDGTITIHFTPMEVNADNEYSEPEELQEYYFEDLDLYESEDEDDV